MPSDSMNNSHEWAVSAMSVANSSINDGRFPGRGFSPKVEANLFSWADLEPWTCLIKLTSCMRAEVTPLPLWVGIKWVLRWWVPTFPLVICYSQFRRVTRIVLKRSVCLHPSQKPCCFTNKHRSRRSPLGPLGCCGLLLKVLFIQFLFSFIHQAAYPLGSSQGSSFDCYQPSYGPKYPT